MDSPFLSKTISTTLPLLGEAECLDSRGPFPTLALLSKASRDMAQMNDLQAQIEESNKEKQELQEKVGTLGSPGSKSSGITGDISLALPVWRVFLPPVSHRAV